MVCANHLSAWKLSFVVQFTNCLNLQRSDVEAKLHEAEQRCSNLEEAVALLQEGPAGEMVNAWAQERADLLSALEEAEDRILRMQGQVCI
jgi:cell division protein FtsB